VITQQVSEIIYDDLNSALVYSSNWQNLSDQQAYNGSYKAVSVRGASVTINFSGQSFSILYTSGPSYGSMDVFIDGVLMGTMDQKSSLTQYQQRWDYTGQLAQGAHILNLVSKYRKNTYNSIDQVIVR